MAGRIPQLSGNGGGTGITRVFNPVTELPVTGSLTCIYDLTDATTPANSGYYAWNATDGIYDRLITLDELEAALAQVTAALAAKEAIAKTQVIVSAASGTLTKNATNIITYSGAGTYTMPALADGEWIRILPRTSGHTINYDGTRSFWLADGTTANSVSVAAGELAGVRLEAFQSAYVGGAK